MTRLEIKYNVIFPIFFGACGLFILGSALIVGFSPRTILGLVILPLSVLMATRPVTILTPTEIQMKNLLGVTVKTHPCTPDSVSVKDKSVYVNGKKVFSTWWSNTSANQVKAFFVANMR